MAYEKPVLSAKEMAIYVADSPYKDYRQKCIEHFKKIHGEDYANAVKAEVINIFQKRKGKKR